LTNPRWPSPPGLPSVEDVTDWEIAINSIDQIHCRPNQIDISGNRIDAYVKSVYLCHDLVQIKKLLSNKKHQDTPFQNVREEMVTTDKMAKRKKILVHIHKERYQLLLNAQSYQRRMTEHWNPSQNELTPLLLLPETPFNDMTTMGNGGMIHPSFSQL
jgi:hypothetical protein